MKDIGGIDDMPNFSDVRIPTIDPAAQAGVDGALASLAASYVPLAAAVKDANAARDALLSWAAIADKVLSMVVPMVNQLLAQHNVPTAEKPNRMSTFLQGLPAVALMPTTEARASGFAALLSGLVRN